MTENNIGNIIVKSINKLDGFDFKWTSLITNNPLLFEDLNYFKVKHYIENIITEKELNAYQSGKLKKVYPTFEHLLIDNLKYYDRIMSYCTMILHHYVDIDGFQYTEGLKKVPIELFLTPTKIWCAVFTSQYSTKWEIEYGWNVNHLKNPHPDTNQSILEVNYKRLYDVSKSFAKFNEYNSIRLGVNGFRQCLLAENTPNKKLAQVCSKFNKTTTALSEEQLQNIFQYSVAINNITDKLYQSLDECLSVMFAGDKSQYSIYILMKEFYIFTSKFTLKVSKENGTISKSYLANAYECFVAEKYLVSSINTQIEWSQFEIPSEFNFDKTILENILLKLLEDNFRNVVCISRPLNMESDKNLIGLKSDRKLIKVTFSGIFANVKISENFMINNRVIKTNTKVLSRKNAVKYLIDKGYYLFGYSEDIEKLLEEEIITRKTLISHYNTYCIPILQHMSDVVNLYKQNGDEIIDVMLDKKIFDDYEFNNDNIIYTSVKNKNEFNLNNIKKRIDNIRQSVKENKKSYWKVIDT